MGKLKALRVNWVVEAWKVRDVVIDMKDIDPGNALSRDYQRPEIAAAKIDALEGLQDRLAEHLAYRMSLQKPQLRPNKGYRWAFNSRDPTYTREQTTYLVDVVGIKFASQELEAITAHILIGQTLERRWISYEDKFELILSVASISMFGGRVASTNRAVPRPRADRRSTLRRETELAVRNHAGETASEILVRLTGGIVESSDASNVMYWAKPGELKTITRDRFENVFTDANNAVAAARAKGQRPRKPSTG